MEGEKLFPRKREIQTDTISESSERIELKRLYVDSNKREYVDVSTEIASKIEDLLHSQVDVANDDDIEALFLASDQVAGANCHKTALFLTGKYSREQLFSPDNDDPRTAGHEYIEANSTIYPEIEAFQTSLASKKFPFRISFFKVKDGKYFAYHSITALGLTNKNNIVGFEKEGPYADTPFRYTNVMRSITGHLRHEYTPGLEK